MGSFAGHGRGRTSERGLEADLVNWGKALLIETVGRHSGRPRPVVVGFVEAPDGSLLVAASDTGTHWALNLLAQPRCLVERQGVRLEHRAIPLDKRDHHAAVAALIMKYGTPAERLGSGPAFRLVPVAPTAGV